jgi:hypothetical protein
MRFIAVATEQVGQFLAADAGEHGRIGDLEPVEMNDRKNRTITRWIQKFIGVQLAASAPVSASLSPMMQATIRFGFVERRAIAMEERTSPDLSRQLRFVPVKTDEPTASAAPGALLLPA